MRSIKTLMKNAIDETSNKLNIHGDIIRHRFVEGLLVACNIRYEIVVSGISIPKSKCHQKNTLNMLSRRTCNTNSDIDISDHI